MGRLDLSPPLVDWTILGVVVLLLGTGVASLWAGTPDRRWVFVLHGVAGFALVVPLYWKLRRVRRRMRPSRWTRHVAVSVLAVVLVVAALATGIYWSSGGDASLGPWTLLTVHAFLGVVLAPVLVVHLARRWRVPEPTDLRDRRSALTVLGLAAAGGVAWRLQRTAADALGSATRRFTGSREVASLSGNAFPATSWVADDPDPVDPSEWTLRARGAVEQPLVFEYDEIVSRDALRATLDCTSGWCSVQDWRGISVGDVLDAAGPAPDGRWVQFRSVTGYRWSLPLDEAREALLATHVGDEPLAHEHGFPLRLVAPGRRGFQWVKWVEEIRVTRRRDVSEYVAVFTSGFE